MKRCHSSLHYPQQCSQVTVEHALGEDASVCVCVCLSVHFLAVYVSVPSLSVAAAVTVICCDGHAM